MSPEDACRTAIAAAGGVNAVASALGISPQAVSQWRLVPVKRCREFAALKRPGGGIVGDAVSIHAMRPDIFDDERRAA